MTRKVDPVSTGRPHIPGYGIPTHTEGLLPWSFALERLEKARNYWVATTRPDGRPHTVPVWGVLVDGVGGFFDFIFDDFDLTAAGAN